MAASGSRLGERGEIMLAKATFFLPINDNDGRDLSSEHQEARKKVFDLFGGWTFIGYYDGAFRMKDGSQSLDRSAAYMVLLEESRIVELETVLREFKSKTMQEAIYLEFQHGIEFRFL
jgi:hypothetical protein